jgi:hypothetical protein
MSSNVVDGNGACSNYDNPIYPVMGFRYSTNASDTTWKAIVTDGTTQLLIDTGVALGSTNTSHIFKITFTNPNVLFYIDGVLVATIAITTTTITTSLLLNGGAFVSNLDTANNQIIYVGYYYWATNP